MVLRKIVFSISNGWNEVQDQTGMFCKPQNHIIHHQHGKIPCKVHLINRMKKEFSKTRRETSFLRIHKI